MGLDLYHLKATLTPARPEDAHSFREDEFDEYALDHLGFRRFVQVIPDFDYPCRILAVKDEASLGHLRALDPERFKEGVEVWVGAPGAFAHFVEEFEKSQGLDGEGRFVQVMTRWIDRSGCHVGYGHVGLTPLPDERHWEPAEEVREAIRRRPPLDRPPVQCASISYPVAAPYRGFYADVAGYQRKGMAAEFYKAFGSPSCTVLRSDVERASHLLDLSGTPEENRRRQEAFATEFLRGFEEGTSLFDVGW